MGAADSRENTHLGSIAALCRLALAAAIESGCWFVGGLLVGGHSKNTSRELSESRIRGCPVVLS